MAIQQLSPGVKVNEVDLTNVIDSAASSIGAYVGDFTWGPIEEVVTISREKELIEKFGKPTKFKSVDFTAMSLFLKYTDHLELVRMADDSARNATADSIVGGRLIRNEDHYDGLTGFLSDNPILNLVATAPSLVGSYTIQVDDVSLVTGGDLVTGNNISAGASIVGIDRNTNTITLSHPLEGVIPVVSFTNEEVEVYDNKLVADFFAEGSQRLQLLDFYAGVNVEYQIGARVSHEHSVGEEPAFPNLTAIYTQAAEFAVGDTLQVTNGTVGTITNIARITGEVTYSVVPGMAGAIVNGTDQIQDPDGDIGVIKSHKIVDELTVGATEAAHFTLGDTVTGSISGTVGQVTRLDTANDVVTVEITTGGPFVPTDVLVSPSRFITNNVIRVLETIQLGVGEAAGFAVNDYVTGSVSGALGIVNAVDTALDTITIGSNTLNTVTGLGGVPFAAGDVLTSPSSGSIGNVASQVNQIVELAPGQVANFATGDTPTGTFTGAAGTVGVVDAANDTIEIIGELTTLYSRADTILVPEEAVVANIAEFVTVVVREVPDGSIFIASPLQYNVPNTDSVLIHQYSNVMVSPAIGSFELTVTDGSFIEIGDEMIEAGIPAGSLVTAVNYLDAVQLGVGEAAQFTVGDRVAAPGGSAAVGTVVGIDAVMDRIFVELDNPAVPFVATDSIDRTRNGAITAAVATVVAIVTPVRYQEMSPATLTLSLAVTDEIPVGTQVENRRVTDLDAKSSTKETFFVLENVNGISQGDDVDIDYAYAEIAPGTEIININPESNVVQFNQSVANYVSHGITLKISNRVRIKEDALAEATSIFLSDTSSVAAGDFIIDLFDSQDGNGLQLGTKVVSVDHSTGEVVLDTKLMGTIPTAVFVNDSVTVDVYRGPWYAKYAGDIGNSLRVEMCGYSEQNTVVTTASAPGLTITLPTGESANLVVGTPVSGAAIASGTKVASISATGDVVTLSKAHSGLNAGDTVTFKDFAFEGWAHKGYFNSAPNTSDYAALRGGANDELHIIIIDEDGKFTGQPGTVLEKFSNLSQASDAKLADSTGNYYVTVINDRSAYIWFGDHDPEMVNAGEEATGTNFAHLSRVVETSLTEGADSGQIGVSEWSQGYELFRDVEIIRIDFLMQPSIPNSDDGKVLQDLLIDVAEFRTDCIALLSPPVELTAYGALKPISDVVDWFDQINSTSYAVFDSCAIKVYDKFNDQYLWIPASSSIAGVCARTDDTNDPWWSPAGYNRGQLKGVVKLAYVPRKTDRDQLYSSRINPLVTFPGEGTILYGDKTALAKPSAFDRINVRRLFITLERAISDAAKYYLFEFNDAFTRAQFVASVEPYLRTVQAGRGIQGFHVVCDETNNTPFVIDTNQFVGDIYIKPNRSINFITLNFVAVRTGVSFSEIATGEYATAS